MAEPMPPEREAAARDLMAYFTKACNEVLQASSLQDQQAIDPQKARRMTLDAFSMLTDGTYKWLKANTATGSPMTHLDAEQIWGIFRKLRGVESEGAGWA